MDDTEGSLEGGVQARLPVGKKPPELLFRALMRNSPHWVTGRA